MQYYEFIACRNDTGASLPFAKITVYLAGSATLASIFDSAGGALPNPVTATITGEVGFAAADGAYDIQIGSADGTYLSPKIHSVQFYDLTTLDAALASGKIISVAVDRTQIKYDGTGTATPSTQTATFSAIKRNTTATVTWTATDLAGGAVTPVTICLSAATGNTVTMTRAQFDAARGSTKGVIVTATATDGGTLTDSATVLAVLDGATGPTGATGPQGIQGAPGYKFFSTWSALAAAPGSTANEAARVAFTDTGTHTDPVVGGTVNNSGEFAWSVSPAGWKRISDLAASTVSTLTYMDNGTTAILHNIYSPPQSVLNNQGKYDNVDWSERSTKSYSADYGNGQDGTDYVHSFGWNQTGSYTPAKAGLPAFTDRWEAGWTFNQGGTWMRQCERHIGALWTADAVGGNERRPITLGLPHTNANYAVGSGITTQVAIVSWQDGQSPANEWMRWDATNPAAPRKFSTNNVTFQENINNLPIHQQMNAAGNALLNLPYINNTNAYLFSRDIFAQPSAPAINALGIQSYIAVQGGTISAGARLLYMGGPSVTGSILAFQFDYSASGNVEGQINNSNAAGKAGLSVNAVGGGYIELLDNTNGKYWGMRYVNSDSTFRLGAQITGVSTGAGDAIVIAYATQQVTFVYPPKKPSYTVAGLPSPTTAGAGSEAFCTNETGGSTPVFSDGTNWRRVADRAIAA